MAEAIRDPEPPSLGGEPRLRVAVVSMHTSPTAALGQSANGGLNVYVREVCAALSDRGIASDVFTRSLEGMSPSEPDFEQLAPLSRVVYVAAGRPGLDKYRLLDEVPGFASRVRALIASSGLRYDLIHSHYWLSGVAACGLRGQLRLPWAHTAHTLAVVKNRHLAPGDVPEPEIRADLEGEVSRCADLLVVNTEVEGRHLMRAYGVRPDRIAVVAPGCAVEVLAGGRAAARQEARARIGYANERLFVFVGRLERLKGVDVALHAMALLTAGGRNPEARLLVLGADSRTGGESEQARLTAMAGGLGVRERVRFLGSVPQSRLADYYRAAEACLVPSYSESFGLVALEAQACGTPVVASNVDGLASIVRDGLTGFLVDGHDPEDYAERMGRLLDDPVLVERIGDRAARLASSFTWARTADRVTDLYEDLVRTNVPRFTGHPQLGVHATPLHA